MTIREMIIEKREESGLTQTELSKKTGISQSRISEFESGIRTMTSDNIDKIFSVLEIEFQANREDQWKFAKECAMILKNKGITSVDNLNQEEIATLTGRDEYLKMKVYEDSVYDSLAVRRAIKGDNTFNLQKELLNFHLALLK